MQIEDEIKKQIERQDQLVEELLKAKDFEAWLEAAPPSKELKEKMWRRYGDIIEVESFESTIKNRDHAIVMAIEQVYEGLAAMDYVKKMVEEQCKQYQKGVRAEKERERIKHPAIIKFVEDYEAHEKSSRE